MCCDISSLIFEKFNIQNMSIDQQITSLSEFIVCQSQQCQQSVSICLKSYFNEIHVSNVNGKNIVHESVSFLESAQFLNFTSINRLHFILTKKIKEALRGIPTDIDTVVQTALYKSDTFKQLFMNSDQAISEYFYMLKIHRGIPMPMAYCFSSDFCSSISIPNEKGVTRLYKQLCEYSSEWNYLNHQFNYASGINSSYLQAFMEQEIAYFSHYCTYVTENKKEFSIREYTSMRNNSKEYTNDPYYYSHEFVTFLVQKYERNPGGEEIFNLKEYYLHFWQYFFVLIDQSKNVNKYFTEEISFYHQFQKEMLEQKLEESFLAFRMWRLNHKTSNYLPSLKNPFFLQTFIYSFIEELIELKLFSPDQKRNDDFKEFARFLRDYTLYVNDKKEEFSFCRYREYANFRRNKAEKLENNLRKHKDIVYDKKFFLEYAHNEFAEGNTLAVKKYRKYQEKRSEEQDEKIKKFRSESSALKSELEAEEKDHFYQILFNSFVTQVQEKHLELTKSAYREYKQNVLESVDETFIQEKNAEFKRNLMEMAEEGEREKTTEKDKTVVKEEINEDEEEIADLIKDEENSEASSDEQERERTENCPCCKGHPYECQEAQCKILGCCSACMLDD